MTILPRPANARISSPYAHEAAASVGAMIPAREAVATVGAMIAARETVATVGALFPAREAVAILPRALRGCIAHGSPQPGNNAPTSHAAPTSKTSHTTPTSGQNKS